jgi:membrane protein implicated in regulation of membrane protease activity
MYIAAAVAAVLAVWVGAKALKKYLHRRRRRAERGERLNIL